MKFSTKFQSKGSSENFIILKDGESVEGVLVGEPLEFWQHWINKIPYACTGRQSCKYCAEGAKAAFRFRMNMVVKNSEGTGLVAKILEQSQTVYGMFQELEESGYALDQIKIKISRKGSGISDTTYNVVPVPKGELNAETLKLVNAVPLNDLAPHAPKQETATQADAVPF